MKDQIEAFLARKAQTDYIAKLRQAAKIERLDKPLQPAALAPPADPKKD